MIIKNIFASNFRNYESLELHFDPLKPINLIHSPNGMGKTNLLEIIYYLSYLRSFRSVQDSELIRKGSSFFFIEGNFDIDKINNKISVKMHEKKEVSINGKKVKKYSEILGKLLSVLFCNEDIFIINGSPLIRRKFFDTFISVIDYQYLHFLNKFQTVLKQKNFILKNGLKGDLIDVYNLQLSTFINYIQNKRKTVIEEINTIFQEYFNKIGIYKEKVKIVYSPSLKIDQCDEEKIYNILNENHKKETEYKYSLFGSHRDNYIFLINGIPFSRYASLGQIRLAFCP